MAKKSEVRVGDVWSAKVNGGQVKITEKIKDSWSNRVKFTVVNVKTGRELKARTAAFFRKLLKREEL